MATSGSLSGNDDCGQMSAWYIFNSMGFYPICPSSNIYPIGTPGLAAVEMELANGKKINVTTDSYSDTNCYIQKVLLNGQLHNKSYFTYNDLKDGAEIKYFLGPTPNKEWGTSDNSVPPSISKKGRTLDYKSTE
nr:glycoside hydrolase domain-containing protein [Marinilabilia salmonicolor]